LLFSPVNSVKSAPVEAGFNFAPAPGFHLGKDNQTGRRLHNQVDLGKSAGTPVPCQNTEALINIEACCCFFSGGPEQPAPVPGCSVELVLSWSVHIPRCGAGRLSILLAWFSVAASPRL